MPRLQSAQELGRLLELFFAEDPEPGDRQQGRRDPLPLNARRTERAVMDVVDPQDGLPSLSTAMRTPLA